MISNSLYRPAAKIVLGLEGSDECVFVAGSRGRLNLPGGGIDEGETAEEALFKELYQELRATPEQVYGLSEIGATWSNEAFTSSEGLPVRPRWKVFAGRLAVARSDLRFASEITRQRVMTPEAYLALPDASSSVLAKRALFLYQQSLSGAQSYN